MYLHTMFDGCLNIEFYWSFTFYTTFVFRFAAERSPKFHNTETRSVSFTQLVAPWYNCSVMQMRLPQALQWRHNERDGVSNNQPHDFLPDRLFRRTSNNTSKLCVTGLCERNSPVTGEFPAQRASNPENTSIWWRHHGISSSCLSRCFRVCI